VCILKASQYALCLYYFQSDRVINAVKGKDLVRLKDYVLIVVHTQAVLLMSRLTLNVEGVVTFCNRPILSETFQELTWILAPADIMHSRTTQQITFDEVGIAKADPATKHAVNSAAICCHLSAHILVTLLGNICKVNTQAVHVTSSPCVGLCAMHTLCAAECSAEALATRDRARA